MKGIGGGRGGGSVRGMCETRGFAVERRKDCNKAVAIMSWAQPGLSRPA